LDRSEKTAKDHLFFRGYLDIVHEPDGNVPPDFLVEGKIAVEVRRLNQNDFTSMPPAGLEEAEIPLTMSFARLLASYGTSGATRFIGLSFGRPLPRWTVLVKEARTFLDAVLAGTVPEGIKQAVAPNVELEYLGTASGAGDAFDLGVVDDRDGGGWVFELLEQNLRLCVAEKTCKIAPYRSRYPEWWLILVDYVACGLLERASEQFRRTTRLTHDWDKVIIVNPADYTDYFEL
jgi:hypothetical protein